VHDLKLKYAKASQKIDDLQDSVVQIAAGFEGSARVEGLTGKSAGECIRAAAERDRRGVAEMRAQVARFSRDFARFKDVFEMALPLEKIGAPQWHASAAYDRATKPVLPAPPQDASVYDYIAYMGRAFPYVQAVLREFHAGMGQLSAAVEQKTDRTEFEIATARTRKELAAIVPDVEDYRSRRAHLVLRQDFEELAEDVYGIVNGASKAAATNTKCIGCGKLVQRTVGSIQPGLSRTATQRSPLSSRGDVTTRTADLLRLDGLQQEPVLGIRRIVTSRTGRPAVVAPRNG